MGGAAPIAALGDTTMHDGHTRKLPATETPTSFDDFVQQWQGSLVIVAGGPEGTDYPLDTARITLGRGPGVDLAFEDDSMSAEHAAVEFANGGFRLRDLNSTNGTWMNDVEVMSADLKNGDRVRLGEHVFQFVLEQRTREPKTYVLPDS